MNERALRYFGLRRLRDRFARLGHAHVDRPSQPRNERSERAGEKGIAILIVVMLTLVVSALGATAVVMSNTNHLVAAAERDSERALLASKAGLEYGYHLFTEGAAPVATPIPFDSFAPPVRDPLKGASFTGLIVPMSSSGGLGRVYRIESTGRYHRAARTTEVVIQVVQDPFEYGYVGFNSMWLHNHGPHHAGSSFHVEATIFSNGAVEVQPDITLDGNIVAGGDAWITNRAVVRGEVFANKIRNYGTIHGKATSLGSLDQLPDEATRWDRVDSVARKYAWFGGNTYAAGIIGDGRFLGGRETYTVRNGDTFKTSIFRKDGRVQADPDLNVIKYIPPPQIDYGQMRATARQYEPTHFSSGAAAMAYLSTKRVTEVIDGKTVTTIRVGTDTFPEFLYVAGDFRLRLDPSAAADDLANGVLRADGFNLEGGIYSSGMLTLNGPTFDPARHPAPPAWYQFRINALPYCYPALVAYQEPVVGNADDWAPGDTPILSAGGSRIEISSAHTQHPDTEAGVPEGFVFINGLTYSQGETHLHHARSDQELIRFNGAEMAYRVHSCNFMSFTYDPAVRCSMFVSPAEVSSTPKVVSFREIR